MITIITRKIIRQCSRCFPGIIAGCLLVLCSAAITVANETGQIISEMPANDILGSATISKSTANNRKLLGSSKETKQNSLTSEKNVTPPSTESILADKLNRKLTGYNATSKKSAKSVATVNIPEALAQLEKIKLKIKNPAGFLYKVSPAGTPSIIKADDLSDTMPPFDVKGVRKSRDSSARAFLRSNRTVLKLADPENELELYKTTTDELGITRHRYKQNYNGIPVWGRELSVYESKSGTVNLFLGNYRPTSTIQDTTPIFSSTDAIKKAITDLDITPAKITKNDATLVLWHDENSKTDYLAWHIEVAAGSTVYWHYFVDAKDGTIRNRYSGIMNGSAVPASGIDLKGKTCNFTVWEKDSYFYMIDVTRPIYDGPIIAVQDTGDITVTDLQKDEISNSTSSTSDWDPAAVSVITKIYAVLDYFKNTHNLNGYSSTQQNIKAGINFNEVNAFFNPQDYSISFGIGDGNEFLNFAGSLDVVAHEFAHGVVAATANLEYQNQSGALNESFADFFGAMVDRDNWIMGEEIFLLNHGVMRDMRNPHDSYGGQPEVMSEYYSGIDDYGGVHTNSGIPNRAAWLVAEGLTIERLGASIGKAKTEKIWYRALDQYLHPKDGFLQARQAMVQAALDLYGDASEAAAVKTAWDTVEVFDGMTGIASSVTPSTVEPLPGTDWFVNVSNGNIYLQTASGEFGPINSFIARNTRPSVVVGSTDTFIFYVDDVVNNLRVINISTFEDTLFDDSYYYWSVAISPNGGKIAYTKQTPEPYIYVVDQKQRTETPYYLAFQTYGGMSIGNVRFADVMNFDFAGKRIVFDAKIDFNWSIGVLDLETGIITAPIPSQNNGVDIGNPVFATNNNYLIAFEYEDSDYNKIVTYNLAANAKDALGIVALRGSGDLSYLSQPFFNGDDTAITFKYSPVSGSSSIKSIPITKTGDAWIGNQGAISTFSPSTGNYPLLFRNSQRIIDSRLSVSPAAIDFGILITGTSSKKTFTILNSGNIDLTIKKMEISGTGFTQNGTIGLLPRNSTMTIEVTYLSSLPGTKSAFLTIFSDADTPNNALVIPITATVNLNKPTASFTVTPLTGNGFTISPATAQTVNNDQTSSFTVTATSGYAIASVTGCGGKLFGTTYITGAVTSDCALSVTAVAVGSTGIGGIITPTISDALKALNSIAGIAQLTQEERLRYDVAPLGSDGKPIGDGIVDAADIVLIMRRSVGIGNWLW
jgi:Zn-dependent metalloprotease